MLLNYISSDILMLKQEDRADQIIASILWSKSLFFYASDILFHFKWM